MKKYVRCDDSDRELWSKISDLHNKLFYDYFGFDDEDEDYDKYAREDAVYSIYEDIKSGVDVREAFDDAFDSVYSTDIPDDIFEEYYKEFWG